MLGLGAAEQKINKGAAVNTDANGYVFLAIGFQTAFFFPVFFIRRARAKAGSRPCTAWMVARVKGGERYSLLV